MLNKAYGNAKKTIEQKHKKRNKSTTLRLNNNIHHINKIHKDEKKVQATNKPVVGE